MSPVQSIPILRIENVTILATGEMYSDCKVFGFQ